MAINDGIAERGKSRGTLLRKARLNAGLDIDACASAIGVAAEQMAAYEAGQSDPSLPQLEILSGLYGVPVTYFWTESVAAPRPEISLEPVVQLSIRRRMIGVLLRQARLAAGKRLSDCAGVLGVSNETISNYEFGREDIPFSQLERLSDLLRVPLSYFADDALMSDSDKERQDLEMFNQLPQDVREFVLRPSNVLYLRLAILLSSLSTDTLRRLGEGLLDITL